jgi:hypothetical protein
LGHVCCEHLKRLQGTGEPIASQDCRLSASKVRQSAEVSSRCNLRTPQKFIGAAPEKNLALMKERPQR